METADLNRVKVVPWFTCGEKPFTGFVAPTVKREKGYMTFSGVFLSKESAQRAMYHVNLEFGTRDCIPEQNSKNGLYWVDCGWVEHKPETKTVKDLFEANVKFGFNDDEEYWRYEGPVEEPGKSVEHSGIVTGIEALDAEMYELHLWAGWGVPRVISVKGNTPVSSE